VITGRKALGCGVPVYNTETCHRGGPAAGVRARSQDSPEMGEVMRCVPTPKARTFAEPDAPFGHLCSVGMAHTDSVGHTGQVVVVNLRDGLLLCWKVWYAHLRARYSLC